MDTTKIDLQKIREQLGYGAQTEIAKRADVTIQTVIKVLNGTSDNQKVWEAIADYLEEQRKKKEDTKRRILAIL